MAYLEDKEDIYSLYTTAVDESRVWRKDYHEFERLADNDLLEDLDENLPEVNDGSLAASLFKLPKRIVSSKLSGRVKSISRDEQWLTEIANLQWENKIIPNANSQAPFHRKWKDAVRKAAIYGSVPLITLFVERGNYTGADFIVAQPQDVTIEPGKVSDYDSDVIFWDVYFTELQLKDMIAQAKTETKEAKKSGNDGYNKWDVPSLEKILASKQKDDRSSQDDNRQKNDKSVTRGGFHFCIVVQRGVEAPFYMYHKGTKKTVREWSNPDPTGDVPIHFLYCYQDFINPYGIGIVKLAGGTQNVLDYMRQADVLATQLGFRPPISIAGNTDNTDFDSILYAQDQQWIVGDAVVKREEISNQVYAELPNRIMMYKTSLNQLIPTGDTSATAAGSGDPTQSKTPAGVKLAAANLSIDDEDFKDNLEMTYESVAKSMINTHFANMQGTDLMKLDEEEQQIMAKAGVQFPTDEQGNPTSEFELTWDEARAEFDFEIDAEADKASDEQQRLEGLLKVAQFRASDPAFDTKLAASGKKLNDGELYSEIISLTTDNDKILEDIGEGDQPQQPVDPNAAKAQQPKLPSESLNYKDAPEDIKRQIEAQAGLQPSTMTSPVQQQIDNQAQTAALSHISSQQQMQQSAQQAAPDPENPQENTQEGGVEEPDPQAMANVKAVMKHYGVDEQIAAAALEAERQGYPIEQVIATMQKHAGAANG